jgi:hypothetical protein
LTKRLERVEANVRMMSRRERDLPDYDDDIHHLAAELSHEKETVRRISAQVNGMMRGLKGTPGYDLRRNFTCDSCGSHGFAAVLVKCTDCGKEGWWGWWPPE